jgi:hypothetical protein
VAEPVREMILVQRLARGARVDVIHQPPGGGPPILLSSDHCTTFGRAVQFGQRFRKFTGLPIRIRAGVEGA